MKTQTIRALGACAIAILLVVTGTCLAIQQTGEGKAGGMPDSGFRSLTENTGIHMQKTHDGILYTIHHGHHHHYHPHLGECPKGSVPVTLRGYPECVPVTPTPSV